MKLQKHSRTLWTFVFLAHGSILSSLPVYLQGTQTSSLIHEGHIPKSWTPIPRVNTKPVQKLADSIYESAKLAFAFDFRYCYPRRSFMKITEQDKSFIEDAAKFFANPGAVAKGLAMLGEPIERLQNRLPEKAKAKISAATKTAIEKALIAAITTLPNEITLNPNDTSVQHEARGIRSSWIHKGTSSITGAIGGFFGLAALPVELPITTTVILRGILDQAQLAGHNIADIETRLECLMVFTMGATPKDEGATETGYFAARISLTQAIRAASSQVAGISVKELMMALDKGAAPAVVRLIAQVAQAFEIRVTQKLVGELLPILGAVGGSAVNYAFADFYCRAARYHFGVRALEKKYGDQPVQKLLKEQLAHWEKS
jgi:hypothetical protein